VTGAVVNVPLTMPLAPLAVTVPGGEPWRAAPPVPSAGATATPFPEATWRETTRSYLDHVATTIH
jgi:hypothetical protein